MLSKITVQHIQLIPYSVMAVRYATQVLNKTVPVAMRWFGGEEATEIAKFSEMMDSLFDCFNTRHLDERDRNHF